MNYAVPIVMVAEEIMEIAGEKVNIHQLNTIFVDEKGQITGVKIVRPIGKEGWDKHSVLDEQW